MYKKVLNNGCYKLAEIQGNAIIERYFGSNNKLVNKSTWKPFSTNNLSDLLNLKGYIKLV